MLPPKLIQIEYLSNQSYVIADVIEGGMGKVLKLYPVLDDLPVVAMKTIRGASSIKLFDAECEAWLSIAVCQAEELKQFNAFFPVFLSDMRSQIFYE
jgi:hypothetical protein